MNKLTAIVKATALISLVLATNVSLATESNNEEVLIPVANPNTGKVEYLHCPTYPDCNHELLERTTKDEQDEDKD